MKITRRNLLQSALFGAGYVGLRALVTGIPAAVLMHGTRALAANPACADSSKAQYIIFMTAGSGDPMNANVPGTYDDAGLIAHSLDPLMAKTALTVGGQPTFAAQPWSTLPQTALDRTNFWHIATNTPVHPKEPDVLGLLGTTTPNEMLPSLLSRQLAPCLGTIQTQPLTIGAASPSEGLRYEGQSLPIIPPVALRKTLANPDGVLENLNALQALRDQTLASLDDIYRGPATKAQKAYLDSLITSQAQVRGIRQDLLTALASIADNSVASQITAALTLIQMKVTPVIAIHIPFGGDNHNDTLLAKETSDTVAALASINSLLSQLGTLGLQDQVSLLSLNVFGRTLGPTNTDGRQHNPNHQVSLAIGAPFRGKIIGGLAPLAGDYGAVAIDSQTGGMGGDIQPADSLASFGKTMLAAVGGDPTVIDTLIASGKIVQGALA